MLANSMKSRMKVKLKRKKINQKRKRRQIKWIKNQIKKWISLSKIKRIRNKKITKKENSVVEVQMKDQMLLRN